LLPEDQVQQVVRVHPTCCPTCHDMLPATLHPACLPARQQVWEIPDVQPDITEYQYLTVCCPGCGDLVTATPSAAIPPGAFGPRVVALIALLHGRYRISNRERVALLQMIWHLPISVGSVAHLQQEASAALAPTHAEAQTAEEQAAHAHVDETSWREGSRTPWLWVAVSAVATLFLLQYGRGKKQLRALLGEHIDGVVTSDRLSAYNSLAPPQRHVCWAHLVRNLRGRAEACGP
jgi:transposase